jgi:isopentenyldiphosphate isomerase
MAEEMLVVCDENNNVLGEKPKSEVHRNGLWHRGAHLWITDGRGNVLQQYRDPRKVILPGVWDIAVAGHVSAGDTPAKTVVREAEEELGLQLSLVDFSPVGRSMAESITITDMPIVEGWQHRVFDYNYVMCREIDLTKLRLERGHVADVRWYPIDRLERDLLSPQTAAQHANRPTDNDKLYTMVINAMRKLTVS